MRRGRRCCRSCSGASAHWCVLRRLRRCRQSSAGSPTRRRPPRGSACGRRPTPLKGLDRSPPQRRHGRGEAQNCAAETTELRRRQRRQRAPLPPPPPLPPPTTPTMMTTAVRASRRRPPAAGRRAAARHVRAFRSELPTQYRLAQRALRPRSRRCVPSNSGRSRRDHADVRGSESNCEQDSHEI